MLTVKPNKDLDDLISKIKYGLELANTVNFNLKGTFTRLRDPITDYYTLIFGVICGLNEFGTRKVSISISEYPNINTYEDSYYKYLIQKGGKWINQSHEFR